MARVTVTVSGSTGSGKSRLAMEIEIALKAIGVSVEWCEDAQEREARLEAWAEAGGHYQPDLPNVVLQEINTPIAVADAVRRLNPCEVNRSLNDVPIPDKVKVEAALARIDDDRTTDDWNEIDEAARWALHALGPDIDFPDVTMRNPISQVFFRAGLLACREYMARFVECGGDASTAQSIRANWWPELGDDPGVPRLFDFAEVAEETEVEGKTAYVSRPITPSQEALPRALQFLSQPQP